VEGSGGGLILGIIPAFAWRDGRKQRKNLRQDRRSPGSILNSGPPVYEAGVLTTRPRHSVLRYYSGIHLGPRKMSVNVSSAPLEIRTAALTNTLPLGAVAVSIQWIVTYEAGGTWKEAVVNSLGRAKYSN
jgi:hypothetical protein